LTKLQTEIKLEERGEKLKLQVVEKKKTIAEV
jgi:hypothetical protein